MEELLAFDEIVIQCHDNPDADAVASGFGLWSYFQEKGKRVRLVYGGPKMQKSNLVLMVQTLRIPIEWVETLEEPELLLTVDCQHGQRNVTALPGRTIAVIDHHQIQRGRALPALHEVRSSYGACATVVWDMLLKAGFDVEDRRELSTALYYGLYMDTNRLQEIYHPMDKDMRDSLRMDRSAIVRFQNTNLSLEELEIAGRALSSYDFDPTHRFAIVEAERCDPNILGIISDMLVEVDTVDVCAVFCMLGGGAKLSVRSCVPETRADELAGYLAAGLGSGGGHLTKAGGFLELDRLLAECRPGDERDLSAGVHRLLRCRLEQYFLGQDIIYAVNFQEDTSRMAVFRRKKAPIAYAWATDLFPVGTEIDIRMLEGEFQVMVEDDVCLMIGVEEEVYPSRRENLLRNYRITRDPYVFQGEYPPTIRDTKLGEVKSLAAHAKICVPKDESLVRARRLERRTKLFTLWDQDSYLLGLEGDWLAARQEDPRDLYIIKNSVFQRLYAPCEPE